MSAESKGLVGDLQRFARRLVRSIRFRRNRFRGRRDECMVPMRDGPHLHTVVWRPPGPGPFPVILTRGYWPGLHDDAVRFCAAGYAYVGQSTRGHGRSEGAGGIAERFFHDAEDGHDALSWLAGQPWCDGRVAMYGKSYWAITQWLVAAAGGHPNLKAIIPQVSSTDPWKSGYWQSGALLLAMTARGRAYDRRHWEAIERLGWREFFSHLPLRTLDELAYGAKPSTGVDAENRQLWRDYVHHSTFDDYWRATCIRADGADGKLAAIDIPVYQMGGFYDAYPGTSLRVFQTLQELGRCPDNRIVINPSDHLNRIVGDRRFGRAAPKDEIALATRWLDHVLNDSGVDSEHDGLAVEPPVRLFAMGANEWRGYAAWPPPEAVPTALYLTADGGLSRDAPSAAESVTRYVYDPADPVPTLGGNHSFSDVNIPDVIRPGPVDQRPNEARPDVLVFSTVSLTEAVEVVGPVELRLFASTSAEDTDFVARLIDVQPDGRAFNLAEGILRARFHGGVWDPPVALVPGAVYELRIELTPTANVFLPGHRIRLHVTSSGFPLWDRNPNTGAPQGQDAAMCVAHQTIHHDRSCPSRLVLSIVDPLLRRP